MAHSVSRPDPFPGPAHPATRQLLPGSIMPAGEQHFVFNLDRLPRSEERQTQGAFAVQAPPGPESNPSMAASAPVRIAVLLAVLSSHSLAQPAGGTTAPLVVETVSLPRAYLRQPFAIRLEARGGVPPYKWELREGLLPSGIDLASDGELAGIATETGEFRFSVTATDSSKPAQQIIQQLSLFVTSPLAVRWGRYPKISGQRLEGSIWVSNQTNRDFDLTVIVVAVNEIGRATAIGYQHFPLQANSDDMEIPFGDNLSRGSYQLNVDVVAEVAATNSIYRARLVPKERFQMEQGP